MIIIPIRLSVFGKSLKTKYPKRVATGNSKYCKGANVAEGANDNAYVIIIWLTVAKKPTPRSHIQVIPMGQTGSNNSEPEP